MTEQQLSLSLPRGGLYAVLAVSCFALSGCDLFNVEIDAKVTASFTVTGTGTEIDKIVEIDPNSNADVRENQDRIKEAKITKITVKIVRLHTENVAAQFLTGRLYAKLSSQEWPALNDENAIAVLQNPVAIANGQEFVLAVTTEQNARLQGLLFPEAGPQKVDVRISGTSDNGPLGFDAQLIMELEVVAGP